jgi:hypothetical protein
MNEPQDREPSWGEPGSIYAPFSTVAFLPDENPTEEIESVIPVGDAWPRWLWPAVACGGMLALVAVLWLVLAGAHRGMLPAVPTSSTDTAVTVVYQPARLTLPPAPVAAPVITTVPSRRTQPVAAHSHASTEPTAGVSASPTPSAPSTLPPPRVPAPPSPTPTGGIGGLGGQPTPSATD